MTDPDALPLIEPGRLYTALEAARLLGVRVCQVYRWANPSDSPKGDSRLKGKLAVQSRRPLRFRGWGLSAFRDLRLRLGVEQCVRRSE